MAVAHRKIHEFASLLADRLGGLWVIVGASSMAFMDQTLRATEDIDLAFDGPLDNDCQFTLFEIAESLSMPVEAVNLAANYYVHRIKNWKKHLILIKKGKKGSVYRPNATLFLLLKWSRLSESDLGDCLHVLKLCSTDELHKRELKAVLSPSKNGDDVSKRRVTLAAAVQAKLARESL